jgi:hypothetical protein
VEKKYLALKYFFFFFFLLELKMSGQYNVTSNRLRKSLDVFKSKMGDQKNGECVVDEYRVCRPLQECHKVKTIKRVEKVPCDPCDPCDMEMKHHDHHEHGYGYSSIGWAVLWFIIIAVIVWLIVYSLRPTWALNEDGELDTGKVLLAAIVIALIIVIVLYIIYAACRGSWY